MYLFNIQERYESVIKKSVLKTWESKYKRFIVASQTHDHANNLNTFRNNLLDFKNRYYLKNEPYAVIYIAFIDYLINDASDRYLKGLCDNLKR